MKDTHPVQAMDGRRHGIDAESDTLDLHCPIPKAEARPHPSLVIPAQAGIQRLFFMLERQPCVYIMASRRNGTLYIGVTSNLLKRVHEHRSHAVEGFTKTHRVDALVWFEQHATMESAITREKSLKEWRRAWKLELVERTNPYWRDLYPEIAGTS